jgi:D-glycero-alpha-D-manno-heptose-7-phosphate kinase
MIISRTPLRMSFVGGGSDMPDFYREHGGAVISTAIDKYVYVTLNRKFDQGIRIAYSKTEEVESVAQIEHKLVRAAMNYLDVPGGIEITTIADIPSRGTGLGSSSSFTVALLQALYAFKNTHVSGEKLGSDACKIEIDICGEPIGKQDQYAAALGGFNLIEFRPDERVVHSPVICQPKTLRTLQSHLLMLYTGLTRSASDLLREQASDVKADAAKRDSLKAMVKLAYTLRDEVQNDNADAFGEILHEGWMLKKSLTKGISSSSIDDWYDTARAHGAIGGKILGAGAGGFLLLYAPPDRHAAISHALPQLRPIPFAFDPFGARVIFYHPTESTPVSESVS